MDGEGDGAAAAAHKGHLRIDDRHVSQETHW